jgi:hypothetical protein
VTSHLLQAQLEASAEQLARRQVRLARNPRTTQLEQARRAANRIGSVLSVAASVVAIYDLSLFARLVP